MYYINCFLIFSILGHFIESFFYSSGDSGILYGYWTPIYGIGTIIILFINKFIEKFNLNKVLKIILLFLGSMIILASVEVLGGYLIKLIFNKVLWDYSNHKLNIGKYTSVEMSLIWGISSILLIYFIKPIVDKIINKIPRFFSYIMIILMIVDLLSTVIIKTL